MSLPLDAGEILTHLNQLGYRNISAEQLKEFQKGKHNPVLTFRCFISYSFLRRPAKAHQIRHTNLPLRSGATARKCVRAVTLRENYQLPGEAGTRPKDRFFRQGEPGGSHQQDCRCYFCEV